MNKQFQILTWIYENQKLKTPIGGVPTLTALTTLMSQNPNAVNVLNVVRWGIGE